MTSPTLEQMVERIDRLTEAATGARNTAPLETIVGARRVAAARKSLHCRIRDLRVAIPLECLADVQTPPAIAALPNTPDWLMGVAAVRGDVASVVDLGRFWNEAPLRIDRGSRFLLLQTPDRSMAVGVLVDQVQGLRPTSTDAMLPARHAGPAAPFALGVVRDDAGLVVLLNVPLLLSAPSLRRFEE